MIGANIIRTFFSRSGTAVINLIVVVICARLLGDEGMGMISLLILTITITNIVVGLWGGAGLVYLTPRHPVRSLLVIGYTWSVIASLVVVWIIQYFKLFPGEFGNNIYLLAIISSFAGINMYILLGKEKIKTHNILTFLQSIFLLSAISVQFYIIDFIDVNAYLWALYVSFGFVWISSSVALMKVKSTKVQKTFTETLQETFDYSKLVQAGSGMQLVNYRFSYYIIDYFLGTAMLGRFSVAVQVVEGIWILGKSFGLVLYSKISNVDYVRESVKISLPLIKISVFGTLFATVIILLLPSGFFTLLFGKDFSGINEILLFLAPGIVFVSATMLYSSFFSGIGLVKINTMGSFIGLVSTLILVVWMVYLYGLIGAAIATSLSYLSSFIYSQYQFKKISGLGFEIYKLRLNDWQQIVKLLKGFFSKEQ